MKGIFIIPTGIGCSIGGHAGDAVCAVNLIASVCDDLIVNPNAVNASDINEMASNCLYVEGSQIDRFLAKCHKFKKVRSNKILLAVNSPVHVNTINSVNAGRVSLGVDIEICELKTPLILIANFGKNGEALGVVEGVNELVGQVSGYDFDALAIQTPIDVSDEVAKNYLNNGGVNPWGGVEAIASRQIATLLNRPVAHAPQERDDSYFNTFLEVVDPRLSAECVSVSYIHCVFKGLSKAPRPATTGIGVEDIDFLITPDGCFGAPHKLCLGRGIPVIVVKENKSVLNNEFPKDCIRVDNYLEAVGLLQSMKIGIKPERVRDIERNK